MVKTILTIPNENDQNGLKWVSQTGPKIGNLAGLCPYSLKNGMHFLTLEK